MINEKHAKPQKVKYKIKTKSNTIGDLKAKKLKSIISNKRQ